GAENTEEEHSLGITQPAGCRWHTVHQVPNAIETGACPELRITQWPRPDRDRQSRHDEAARDTGPPADQVAPTQEQIGGNTQQNDRAQRNQPAEDEELLGPYPDIGVIR